MRNHAFWLYILFVIMFSFSRPVSAQLTLGAKGWYADLEDSKDPTLFWGPVAKLDLGNDWWLSSMYLQGETTFDYGYAFPVHPVETYKVKMSDAEVVVGKSFKHFDVGAGWRYTKLESPMFWSDDEHGPMIYLGTGGEIGPDGLGWYLGGSWVFASMGDSGDFEHFNVEGGIFYAKDRLQLTVGPRVKKYTEDSFRVGSDQIVGISTSVEWKF